MTDIHRKPLRRKNDPAPCTDPECDGGLCKVCNGWGIRSTWMIVEPDEDYLKQWKDGNYSAVACPHGCERPRTYLSVGPVYEAEAGR